MKKRALILTAFAVPLLMVFPVGANAASGSIGAPTSGPMPSRSTPHLPRALAFSSPRISVGVSAPRRTLTSAIACDGSYDVVSSPNGTGHNDIFSTSAISPNDVWAVGIQTNASGYDRTLAEHWNGTAWTIIPTPNPGTTHNDLNSVAAISSTDVWVVGDYFDSLIGAWLEFAIHWNGSAWTTTIFNYGFLLSVTAVASNDVWAVGTTYFSPFVTVAMHWNGSAWSGVSTPDPSLFDNELFYVAAFSSTDVWAVGDQEANSGDPFLSLAIHWNGTVWSTVSTPNDTGSNIIAAVAPLEAGHAVGVGYGGFVSAVSSAHGETWDLLTGGPSTAAPLAGPGSGDNILEAVAVSGAGVWAVGFWRATTVSARQTLAFPGTWNSSTHTLTWGAMGTSASPGSANSVLFAVSAISPSVFWAAGYANSGAFDQSLMESYCGLQLAISAPASTFAGAAFSVTVTAKNPNGSTNTGYAGTVHFTSTDALAVIPGDYSFVPGDAGAHTFSGVILNTPHIRSIAVSDIATPFISASVVITVWCRGACQAPTGAPGSRGTSQATPPGSPGSRSTDQSTGGAPAGPPGARIAALGPRTVDAPASGSNPIAGTGNTVAPSKTSPAEALVPAGAVTHGIAGRRLTSLESSVMTYSASGRETPAPGANATSPAIVGTTLALIAMLLLWARRRNNRRLHGKSRP
jgi:hypothetical protein